MIVRTAEERATLIEAGKRLGVILEQLASETKAGVSTLALDQRAEELIRAGGDLPAFKDYTPEGARVAYPASLCISVNDEVVHGIPKSDHILKEGDIVALDLGLVHDGIVVDSALSMAVGKTDKDSYALMDSTRDALEAGILAARPGNRIGDISHAIEEKAAGFGVVRIVGGHGVGHAVHEEPYVPNFGHPGTGPEIVEGMVLALEPIFNAGKAAVNLMNDGYTLRTKDGSRSAHSEHTILIEKDGTLVVTRRPSEA